jgi:hypothetical protein
VYSRALEIIKSRLTRRIGLAATIVCRFDTSARVPDITACDTGKFSSWDSFASVGQCNMGQCSR